MKRNDYLLGLSGAVYCEFAFGVGFPMLLGVKYIKRTIPENEMVLALVAAFGIPIVIVFVLTMRYLNTNKGIISVSSMVKPLIVTSLCMVAIAIFVINLL